LVPTSGSAVFLAGAVVRQSERMVLGAAPGHGLCASKPALQVPPSANASLAPPAKPVMWLG
ncbi:MAG: hypothetical protein ACRD0B_13210, partial [Acidimicrobiales bacterium]